MQLIRPYNDISVFTVPILLRNKKKIIRNVKHMTMVILSSAAIVYQANRYHSFSRGYYCYLLPILLGIIYSNYQSAPSR